MQNGRSCDRLWSQKKGNIKKKKKGKKKPLRSDFSQDFLRTAATTEIYETWSQNSSSQHSQRSESDVIVCLDHCHIFLYIFFFCINTIVITSFNVINLSFAKQLYMQLYADPMLFVCYNCFLHKYMSAIIKMMSPVSF